MPKITFTNNNNNYASFHIAAWLCPMAQVSAVKLYLYLIKLHDVKTYGEVEVLLHTFLSLLKTKLVAHPYWILLFCGYGQG
jgi:hypothetical protein